MSPRSKKSVPPAPPSHHPPCSTRRAFMRNAGEVTMLATVGGNLAACAGLDALDSDLSITLMDHPELGTVGETVLIEAGLTSPLALTRLGDEEFLITGTECNHESCSVDLNKDGQGWTCPCHGARFTLDGSVTRGPATKDLTPYKYELTGDILTILASVG